MFHRSGLVRWRPPTLPPLFFNHFVVPSLMQICRNASHQVIIKRHLFHQLFVCFVIHPSSLFCCSIRVSLNCLTLAYRHSCSSVSFWFSFSCCSICLNLHYLCIFTMLLHPIKLAFISLTFSSFLHIVNSCQSRSMSLAFKEEFFEWLLHIQRKNQMYLSMSINITVWKWIQHEFSSNETSLLEASTKSQGNRMAFEICPHFPLFASLILIESHCTSALAMPIKVQGVNSLRMIMRQRNNK